jgi:anti-anti-sigma factor
MLSTIQPPTDKRQSRFETAVTECKRATVVHLKGCVDIASVDRLEFVLMRVLDQSPNLVVLDLSELQQLSSLAIGKLMTFRRAIVYSGGDVKLGPMCPEIRSELESLQLIDWFGCLI